MPTSEQILNGLTALANQWQWLAILWHLFFAVLLGGLIFGVRPSQRLGGILLALPLVSVSALAWWSGNPFNGSTFALAALALIVIAIRMPDERISLAPVWGVVAGVLMFGFGWVYPHFLETTSFAPYLIAAPVGLAPCPTLSIVIGMSLIVAGFRSRAWGVTLGVMGLFYGIFGAVRLGVTIDWILLLGAVLVLALAFAPRVRGNKGFLAQKV